MWTHANLKQLARRYGEPSSAAWDALVLAHERFRGRTEEDYPPAQAQQELDRLLDAHPDLIPSEADHEYLGLTQLRSYAMERDRQRDAETYHHRKSDMDYA